jgi:hypothetical protein
VAERLPSISRTSADSGEPPHFAAHPPQDVHSVSLSTPLAVSTAEVSQECQDSRRVTLEPGAKVEVRTAFDRTWATGFEVLDASEDGYRLRRLSDGSPLPVVIAPDDVRRERRDANMWWI